MLPKETNIEGSIQERFELLTVVAAGLGSQRHILGLRGTCRFCGRTTSKRFRKKAHTFPQALGNKWIFSRDECEDCNAIFGRYESELSASAGALLTLGGTIGANNKVRQTGRSDGPIAITRTRIGEQPRISYQINLEDRPVESTIQFNGDQELIIKVPGPAEVFRPRLAYKALAKMGFSILPSDEIQHFEKLRRWLLTPIDQEPFPFLEVGFSYASVGNAPPLISGALIRRVSESDHLPYLIFLFCAGSACWQIDMLPDEKDNHIASATFGALNIRWRNVIADDHGQNGIEIDYGLPIHMDWSSSELSLPPIEWIESYFDYRTCEGRFTPHFRQMFPS